MSTTSRTSPAPILRSLGNGRFAMTDRYQPTITLVLAIDQLRLYLQYDADLRGGAPPGLIPAPCGYDDFAVTLNTNAEGGIWVAFVPEGGAVVRIEGRPPALAELVGMEAARRPAPPQARDPRETEGGAWLDPRQQKLMHGALWDNLERIAKQKEWKTKSVTERLAKKRKREDDELMKPFSPSFGPPPTVAGPSNIPHNTPAAPTLPAPRIPPPPVDRDDTMLGDAPALVAREAGTNPEN
ncbi:hypothetical protein P692DRAFT_20823390 [Suillus brevipes Sb2]|nr:hypothetical protein P692DRAFT_20823390 [Suillus brevipes Sb2]